MPTEAEVVTSVVWSGGSAVCLARILGLDGAYLQQADVSSISYTIYDLDNSKTVIATGAPVVASSIFDALQTGQIWTKDETGYNFKVILGTASFPTAGRRYRAVFSFVTVSWGTQPVPFELYAADPTG